MQKLLLALFSIFVSSTLFGQFATPELIVPQDAFTESIELADLNGDGHEDLITSSPFSWYEGKGEGTFFQQNKIGTSTSAILSKIEINDFDQDGDLDVMVAEPSNKTLLWYENDGQGNFEGAHIVSNTLEFPQDFAINDWDKDGDMDILVTLADGANALENGKIISFENIGEGMFSSYNTIISSPMRGYHKLFLADLTNNGYDDIVVNHTGKGVLIINALGAGNYDTHEGSEQSNELALYETSSIYYAPTFEATFADFNEDGYLDIIPRFDNYKSIVWFENNQSGRFFESHLIHTDTYKLSEITATDIDGNGHADIFFGGRNISWFKNQGNGIFLPEQTIRSVTGVYDIGEIIVKDLNKDGYSDLLISDNKLLVYWIEGEQKWDFNEFHYLISYLDNTIIGSKHNYHWEDVNCDGFKDLVFFNKDVERVFWFKNNGKGDFSLGQNLLPDLPPLYNRPIIHFADLNGDNCKDIIIGTKLFSNSMMSYINEGGGNFTEFQEIDMDGFSETVTMVNSEDFDQDGDMDLVFFPPVYATNDGTGFVTLNALEFPENTWWFNRMISEDLDKDGWTDVFLEQSSALYWMRNLEGNGFDSITQIIEEEEFSYKQTHLKDFDNDGYLDILFSTSISSEDNQIYIYKNNQGTGFAARELVFQTQNPIKDWKFQDLDQDTDEDLIVNTKTFEGSEDGNNWLWYENKGGNHFGGFIPIAFVPSFWEDTETLLIEDMDYDGDNDLLLFDDGYQSRLYFVENFYDLKQTITGYSFLDSNENGIFDADEISLTDQQTLLEPTSRASFTNTEGKFFHSVYPGTYQLTYQESTLWELTSPNENYSVTITGEDIPPLYNFGFKPTRILPKVEPYINSTPTRCSMQSMYFLDYFNTGTTIAKGTITLEINDLMTLVEATPPPNIIEEGKLIWHFSDLHPTHQKQILLNFQMPNFNSIGEILETQATVEFFNDNQELIYSKSTNYDSEVLCSYDPNDKLTRSNLLGQSEFAYLADTILYTVRFQNTGNDTAFNIRIEDTLDKKLDWTTFYPITASHEYRTELNRETGLVTFYFNDIMLPDSTTNEPESHGFVMFGIASLPNLQDKIEVDNTASIFFDFNPPIITNTATLTLIEQVETNIEVLENGASIRVFPNPFSDYTTIEVNGLSAKGDYRLELMDILGRKVRELNLKNGEVRLDRGDLESGLYLIQVLEEESSEILGSGKVLVE